MGKAVGRWLKIGKRRLYSQQFATKAGARRAATKAAKEAGEGWYAGEPFRWEAHWLIYIHKRG